MASTETYCKSSVCPSGTDGMVLISGFYEEGPVIVEVCIRDREFVGLTPMYDVGMTGEGCSAALQMFRYRGYDPLNSTVEHACYVAYEAKRFAECVDSVGPLTRIKIHRNDSNPGARESRFMDVSAAGLDRLEKIRNAAFLRSIPKVDAFDDSCFADRSV